MADETSTTESTSVKSTIILMVVAGLSMAVVVMAGIMIRDTKKKETAEILAKNAAKSSEAVVEEEVKPYISKVIPLETFIVNLVGNNGRRIVKVSVELELEGENAPEEFQTRKVQIRDKVIGMLSNQTYEDMQSKVGKEALRETIKDSLNEILHQAKVKTVYFTDIIYN